MQTDVFVLPLPFQHDSVKILHQLKSHKYEGILHSRIRVFHADIVLKRPCGSNLFSLPTDYLLSRCDRKEGKGQVQLFSVYPVTE